MIWHLRDKEGRECLEAQVLQGRIAHQHIILIGPMSTLNAVENARHLSQRCHAQRGPCRVLCLAHMPTSTVVAGGISLSHLR